MTWRNEAKAMTWSCKGSNLSLVAWSMVATCRKDPTKTAVSIVLGSL